MLPTCLQHVFNNCQHVSTILNTCKHLPTRVNTCQQYSTRVNNTQPCACPNMRFPTRVNMCQHLPLFSNMFTTLSKTQPTCDQHFPTRDKHLLNNCPTSSQHCPKYWTRHSATLVNHLSNNCQAHTIVQRCVNTLSTLVKHLPKHFHEHLSQMRVRQLPKHLS